MFGRSSCRRICAGWEPGGISESRSRRKPDEYLYAVRDIEARIQKTESAQVVVPAIDKPGASVPANYVEHTKLMFDPITVAFQTDSTRIVTFPMAIGQSNRAYREIGIADSHHGPDAPWESGVFVGSAGEFCARSWQDGKTVRSTRARRNQLREGRKD